MGAVGVTWTWADTGSVTDIRRRSSSQIRSRRCPAARPIRSGHEVRDRYPAVLRGRRVRPRGFPRLSCPRRGARFPQRLGPGADAGFVAAAQPARGDDLRRGVHWPPAARLRGVRVHAAQPGAPREGHCVAGPAQPRPDRGGGWQRRQDAAVRRVRPRAGPVRGAVRRGRRAAEGAVDPGAGDIPG